MREAPAAMARNRKSQRVARAAAHPLVLKHRRRLRTWRSHWKRALWCLMNRRPPP